MHTSNPMRLLAAAILFAGVWVIVYANLRLLALWFIGRKVNRFAAAVWLLLLAVVVFCVVDATKIEPNWVQATHHTIQTSKLYPGSRIRLVHLTDFHSEKPALREERMVELVGREKPDLIVLTGDYTVDKSPQTMRRLSKIVAELRRIAPVYAVEGNWDADDDMQALREGGAAILTGWTVFRRAGGPKIALGALHWYRPGEPRPPKTLAGLYKVLLCHKPDPFEAAARCRVDLMLAGHTHGGQVRIPVFGALLPDQQLVGRYQAGMYYCRDSVLYVNRGIGMEGGAAPRVRFCCRPEVAVIDIVGRR
ncbi:MAG: metallophosphoesterase family protein [Armatimonadota bacterium]|nr:metallophosphoesterase family protein [Armatimonadota bacterium]